MFSCRCVVIFLQKLINRTQYYQALVAVSHNFGLDLWYLCVNIHQSIWMFTRLHSDELQHNGHRGFVPLVLSKHFLILE